MLKLEHFLGCWRSWLLLTKWETILKKICRVVGRKLLLWKKTKWGLSAEFSILTPLLHMESFACFLKSGLHQDSDVIGLGQGPAFNVLLNDSQVTPVCVQGWQSLVWSNVQHVFQARKVKGRRKLQLAPVFSSLLLNFSCMGSLLLLFCQVWLLCW